METELKFQIPAAALPALRRALAPTARTRLRACYFDTPDRRLAAAGMALRLRLEGRRWVQTLKCRGDGHMRRPEHEVQLGSGRGMPELDPARHAGSEPGDALLALLAKAGQQQPPPALQPIFETRVWRSHRLMRSGGAQIELALDEGELFAGAARAPICELEFELKSGPLQALLDLAGRWLQRHGLWLDVRSKAERGELLAAGRPAGAPQLAENPPLAASLAPDAALRRMVDACLRQVLPNAAVLAAGVGKPEHLHQLRVGLRRLRSALRLFAAWAGGEADAALIARLDQPLAEIAQQLGLARDRQLLQLALLPQLAAAGAPPLKLPGPAAAGDAVLRQLRSPEFGLLMLALIGFANGQPDPSSDGEAAQPAAAAARRRLQGLARRLRREARGFAAAKDEDRHRLRRRLKRLRYGLELSASLLPGKLRRQLLDELKPAQELLGQYNDLCQAEALLRALPRREGGHWFALGWLAAQRAPLLRRAGRALKRWAKP